MSSPRIDNTELKIKERDLKGEFVSHYTSVETLIDHILKDNRIKFSTLENLNDPHEYRVDLGVVNSSTQENKNTSFYPDAEDFIKDNIKIFCTSKSSNFELNHKHAPITKCSFGNVMMWAQYSANHQGVSLLFDRKKLESILKHRFEHTFIEEVLYTDVSQRQKNPIRYNEHDFFENLISELKKDRKTRFFVKQEEWNAEREVRWMVFDENKKGNDFINYGSSLKAIFMGDRTPEKYERIIEDLVQDKEVDLFRLSWDQISKNSFVMKQINQ